MAPLLSPRSIPARRPALLFQLLGALPAVLSALLAVLSALLVVLGASLGLGSTPAAAEPGPAACPSGGFAPGASLGREQTAPYALAVGDLNADGLVDVVVGYVEAESVAYIRTGATFARVRFGDGRGTVYGFAIGDVDLDGQVDIAAGRSEAPNVLYFGKKAVLKPAQRTVPLTSAPSASPRRPRRLPTR